MGQGNECGHESVDDEGEVSMREYRKCIDE